jgi:hypothetical protein
MHKGVESFQNKQSAIAARRSGTSFCNTSPGDFEGLMQKDVTKRRLAMADC